MAVASSFVQEEFEALRNEITCPRPHSLDVAVLSSKTKDQARFVP